MYPRSISETTLEVANVLCRSKAEILLAFTEVKGNIIKLNQPDWEGHRMRDSLKPLANVDLKRSTVDAAMMS